MTRALFLNRHEDVNGVSGTGRVWEGVLFSNGWVAGKWTTVTPSYGWYPSLECVNKIHGHDGRTSIVFKDVITQGNYVFLEAIDKKSVTDSCQWIAEGLEFPDGWIVLLQLAKYTSVYWYRNIDELRQITGRRSVAHQVRQQIAEFPLSHPCWSREMIFK